MGDRLCLDIVVANHGSCDVWVRRVECLMMNSNYDKQCVASVADVVCRGQRETFSFQFIPDPEDVGKLVKMDEVHVTVGSDRFNIVVKKSFAGDAEAAVVAGGTPFGRDAANPAGGPRTRVVPRESQMEVEFRHAAPTLVGEWIWTLSNWDAGKISPTLRAATGKPRASSVCVQRICVTVPRLPCSRPVPKSWHSTSPSSSFSSSSSWSPWASS